MIFCTQNSLTYGVRLRQRPNNSVAMVGYNELVQRTALYLAATLGLCLLSHNAVACFALLTACACALAWHAKEDILFMLASAAFFTLVEISVYFGSSGAVIYDSSPPALGVHLWVVPWWAVRARWVLDLYCFAGLASKPKEDKDPSASV